LQILIKIESSLKRSLRGALGHGLFGLCVNPSLHLWRAFCEDMSMGVVKEIATLDDKWFTRNLA